jgi:hypothetical protein
MRIIFIQIGLFSPVNSLHNVFSSLNVKNVSYGHITPSLKMPDDATILFIKSTEWEPNASDFN